MNPIIDSDTAVQSYINDLLFTGMTAPELKQEPLSLQESQTEAFNTINDVKTGESAQAAVGISLDLDALDKNTACKDIAEPPQKAIDSPFLKQFEMAQKRLQRSAHARSQDRHPEWAAERFKCVIFKVANLKLALPLSVVSGMYPLKTSSLKPVESSSEIDATDDAHSWRLGKLPSVTDEGDCIDIINTARLVMPERYSAAMPENYRLVLAINNCDWGFAVDSVGGEVEFEAQKVRWRSEHTRREWLAGTVVDKMCAIVDIEVINRHLLADSILADVDDTEH